MQNVVLKLQRKRTLGRRKQSRTIKLEMCYEDEIMLYGVR